MLYFITDLELIETITDPSESMEERQYALSTLNSRNTGYNDSASEEQVQMFCDSRIGAY